nr:MAG TPA: hypothetical protein [Crassvirales sp.]
MFWLMMNSLKHIACESSVLFGLIVLISFN